MSRFFLYIQYTSIILLMILVSYTAYTYARLSNYWGTDAQVLITSLPYNEFIDEYCILQNYSGQIDTIYYTSEDQISGFSLQVDEDTRVFSKIFELSEIDSETDMYVDNIPISSEQFLENPTQLQAGESASVEKCIHSNNIQKSNRILRVLFFSDLEQQNELE